MTDYFDKTAPSGCKIFMELVVSFLVLRVDAQGKQQST